MPETTYAYVAGLIDGEGSISFQVNRYSRIKTGEAVSYYIPRLRIGMTNKEIILWLCDTFGGCVTERAFKNPKFNNAYCWEIKGDKLRLLLIRVRPYMRLKQRHCEIALEKFVHRNPGQGNKNLTKIEIERFEKMHNELKALNIRGVLQVT